MTWFRILIYACVMSWYIVPLYSSSYPRSNYIDRHQFTVTVLFIFELSSPFVVWPCVWLNFAPWLICVWCNISCFAAAAPVLTKIPLAFARGYSQKEGSQLKTSSSHLCMCILYQLINKSLVGQEYADKEHIRSFRM